MAIETRVISLFLLNVALRAHFWHHFFILMSLNIKIQDGHRLPIPFSSVLSHITHITCWISHGKLVFSYMCLFPGIILKTPNFKIQDGHQRSYWKFRSNENSPRNRYNITFHINYCTQSPFLASFVHFDRSEFQNSSWSSSAISIVFRIKPSDPLFLLNVTSETRFKQSLWKYVKKHYIESTMFTRKVEINIFFK